MEAYLGNKKTDDPGLEPKDIKLLLDGIHNHALNWNNVEQTVLPDLDGVRSVLCRNRRVWPCVIPF